MQNAFLIKRRRKMPLAPRVVPVSFLLLPKRIKVLSNFIILHLSAEISSFLA
jgi:hypothetical protein